MSTIRKRGDRYQVQVRRKGYPTATKSFGLLSDAREWATRQERLADRGEMGTSRKELDRITLADLINRYLAEVLPTKRHGDTDRFALGMILRSTIAAKPLSRLLPSDFNKYRDERLKDVSPATLKRQLNPLRHMFGHARTQWNIPVIDPLTRIRFPASDQRRERRLSSNELARLESAVKLTRNKRIWPIIQFALETAMRRGEILALQRRDVDFDHMTVTIRQSKNGYSRTIPLTDRAGQIIEQMLVDRSPSASIPVFGVTALSVRLAWDRLTTRAEVDDLHFHDLRHEAISRLFECGLTVPEVASVSGHRDARMLLRYAHADHKAIVAKIAARGTLSNNHPLS